MSRLLLIIGVVVVAGCYAPRTVVSSASNTPTAPVALIPAIYTYNTPEIHVADSLPIKFLLYAPRILGNIANANTEFLDGFKNGFKDDVKEIMTHKGFLYKGLFDNLTVPVYTDYKYADLTFESTIAVNIKIPETQMNQTTNPISGITTYHYFIHNYASIESLVQLKINTSQGVLLWNKTIPVETRTFLLQSKKYSYFLSNLPENPSVPLNDPGVWNPFVTNLQLVYQDILSKIWNQINLDEIKELQKQANELKTKK